MIQVNRIYLIFNRLVTKKFLVDTSDLVIIIRVVNYLLLSIKTQSSYPILKITV